MKNKFTGFFDVFRFAYLQSVKTKAYVISLVVLCAIALAAFPAISLLSGDETEEGDEAKAELIGTIYIEDGAMEGELAKALGQKITSSEDYAGKDFVAIGASEHDEIFDKVKKSDNGDVLIQIEYIADPEDMDYGFEYVVYYGEETDDLDEAGDALASYVDSVHEEVLAGMFIDSEDGARLASYEYSTVVMEIDEEGEVVEDKGYLDGAEYAITYAFLMIAIFAISIVGSKVAEQIVTEKSSKVIEYIMTSIRPMALITGKVVASIAIVLTMVVAVVASFLASALINGMMFKEADGSMMIPETIKFLFDGSVMEGANIGSVILAVVLFVLGFVFYGFIAGIAGATVSKVEEMAEGVKIFNFAMIIGAYVVIAYVMSATMGGGDWGVFSDVIYLCPLTSVFIVPAYVLLGKVSVAMTLLSVAIMIACILLLMVFVSGIYEYLIYYNGSPLKMKDLIGIFRNKRRAE